MRKRLISILTAVALLLSLTACGQQDAGEPTSTTKPTVTTEPTAASDRTEPTGQAGAVLPNSTYSGNATALSMDSITVSTDAGAVTVELTDATAFSMEFTMSGMQPGGMGELPSGIGQPTEGMGGETPPEVPNGETANAGQEGTPPEMPQNDPAADAGQEGTPPEIPQNDPAAGAGQEGTPPEIPQNDPAAGAGQEGTPPEMPQGDAGQAGSTEIQIIGGQTQTQTLTITLQDLSLGDTVTVQTDDEGKAASVTVSGSGMSMPGGFMEMPGNMTSGGSMGMPGGMASGVDSYDAATEFSADANESGAAYASTGTDENAILVCEGAAVSLTDAAISRDSADSTGGDNASFYGVGAAALVTDGQLTVADSTIRSDAAGGAGVFAYGPGIAYVLNTTIDTAQDTSGGIHVAGGGTLYAWDLTVETDGESSAAIRSDRGSGTMVVDGGTYISNGVGSPVIYSAADISVRNASLTATGSEAICIEGLNTIRLFNCDLSGNMKDLSQNDCTWNVILYQSMSGDSQIGNSTFEMIGGSLTAGNGGMFYTTNTESTFLLSGVDITYAEDSEFFLKCTGNANQRGWGTAGRNGADCRFTAIGQAMEGDVIWDSISQLDLYILEGSTLTGAVRNDESNAGNGGSGYAALHIDRDSTWTVTGDSTVTELHCAGSIVDAEGNAVTVTGTDGTVYIQGSSQFTVTVGSYDTAVDTTGASVPDNWSDFAVAKPE